MTKRYALIPVKELDRAKARLSAVLDDTARRELALAMFHDVLDAALTCSALDGVAAVSRDQTVLAAATEAGAEALAARGGPSAGSGQAPSAGSGQALNQALTSAVEQLRVRGVDRVLVLATDLPLADAESLAAALDADGDVIVVPSGDGGTNALLCAPGAIDFQFGPDSARKHLNAAEAAGLRALRLELPRLALDIDTQDDLDRLPAARDATGAHTLAALARFGLLGSPARKR